jgi:hypothetical protein
MGAVVGVFLGIGGFALLLLILALVGGHLHLGHVHVGHLHVGHLHIGHPQAGQAHGAELSLPVIAGFLGAFGFGGAIAASLLPGRAALLAAVLIGLLAALPAGWLAGRLVNAAINTPTDGTLTSGDLIGVVGLVITAVPEAGTARRASPSPVNR